MMDLKCLTGGLGGTGASGVMIGRSMCQWYLSDGMTGHPRNGWFVGIVGKNVANIE